MPEPPLPASEPPETLPGPALGGVTEDGEVGDGPEPVGLVLELEPDTPVELVPGAPAEPEVPVAELPVLLLGVRSDMVEVHAVSANAQATRVSHLNIKFS